MGPTRTGPSVTYGPPAGEISSRSVGRLHPGGDADEARVRAELGANQLRRDARGDAGRAGVTGRDPLGERREDSLGQADAASDRDALRIDDPVELQERDGELVDEVAEELVHAGV